MSTSKHRGARRSRSAAHRQLTVAVFASGALLAAAWAVAPVETATPGPPAEPAPPVAGEADSGSLSAADRELLDSLRAKQARVAALQVRRAAITAFASEAQPQLQRDLRELIDLAWAGDIEAVHLRYHGTDSAGPAALELLETQRLVTRLLRWEVGRRLVKRHAIDVGDSQTRGRFHAADCLQLLDYGAVDPLALFGPRGLHKRQPLTISVERIASMTDGDQVASCQLTVIRDGQRAYLTETIDVAHLDGRWRIRSPFGLGNGWTARHRLRSTLRSLQRPEAATKIADALKAAQSLKASLASAASERAFLTTLAPPPSPPARPRVPAVVLVPDRGADGFTWDPAADRFESIARDRIKTPRLWVTGVARKGRTLRFEGGTGDAPRDLGQLGKAPSRSRAQQWAWLAGRGLAVGLHNPSSGRAPSQLEVVEVGALEHRLHKRLPTRLVSLPGRADRVVGAPVGSLVAVATTHQLLLIDLDRPAAPPRIAAADLPVCWARHRGNHIVWSADGRQLAWLVGDRVSLLALRSPGASRWELEDDERALRGCYWEGGALRVAVRSGSKLAIFGWSGTGRARQLSRWHELPYGLVRRAIVER